ncbi:RsmD family RNA methyltransferase [Riemerella columbina]|uniref:RsmD family RNA methyltransferase n=1 Tax=Riemerella columbina TaxID=103810 RepID=UPI00035C6DF3|nr:RsmD family RNA methyltransferase [Riemerella columbina]
MYRIISGKWKAKRIAAPKNFEVRPTTDFAKEALFSILAHRMDFPFITALDLFAGIGSITLELASRDCPDITAVEMNAKHAGFINTTAQELDFGLQVNIQRSDVFEWLKKHRNLGKTYDLIFADPPFDLPEQKYQDLISLVLEGNLLKDNGIFVLEHQSRMKLEHPNIQDTRKYGNVSFSFIEP